MRRRPCRAVPGAGGGPRRGAAAPSQRARRGGGSSPMAAAWCRALRAARVPCRGACAASSSGSAVSAAGTPRPAAQPGQRARLPPGRLWGSESPATLPGTLGSGAGGDPLGAAVKPSLAGASWGLLRRRGAPGARGEYGAVPLHRSKRPASGVVWSRRHSPSCSRPFSFCAASPARRAGGAARGKAAGSRPGGSRIRDLVVKIQVASGRRVCCRWRSNGSCKQVRGSWFWLGGYSGKC